MNTPNDTRMKYDFGSYQEELARSIYPGIYQLNSPYNDCNNCGVTIPDDPYIRYQGYGQNTCTMKKAVDDSSELSGLNYKNSKCNKDAYSPNSYNSSGCKTRINTEARKCAIPTESCRLSNPPCTLKETGINRYDPLFWNPQERAIEKFDRIGINYRMVAKDNHIPLIEQPQDQIIFNPSTNNQGIVSENSLNQWQDLNQKNKNYSPGYPYGEPNYLLSCKQPVNTY
jgi:hypothetical protein